MRTAACALHSVVPGCYIRQPGKPTQNEKSSSVQRDRAEEQSLADCAAAHARQAELFQERGHYVGCLQDVLREMPDDVAAQARQLVLKAFADDSSSSAPDIPTLPPTQPAPSAPPCLNPSHQAVPEGNAAMPLQSRLALEGGLCAQPQQLCTARRQKRQKQEFPKHLFLKATDVDPLASEGAAQALLISNGGIAAAPALFSQPGAKASPPLHDTIPPPGQLLHCDVDSAAHGGLAAPDAVAMWPPADWDGSADFMPSRPPHQAAHAPQIALQHASADAAPCSTVTTPTFSAHAPLPCSVAHLSRAPLSGTEHPSPGAGASHLMILQHRAVAASATCPGSVSMRPCASGDVSTAIRTPPARSQASAASSGQEAAMRALATMVEHDGAFAPAAQTNRGRGRGLSDPFGPDGSGARRAPLDDGEWRAYPFFAYLRMLPSVDVL